MINTAKLLSRMAQATKVGGLHGGRAGRLVTSKAIIEVTVRRRLRQEQGGMLAEAADRSRSLDERGNLGGLPDAGR